MTDNTQSNQTDTPKPGPKPGPKSGVNYDPNFVPAFRAGMNRLSRAEVDYLDSIITPEVAFLLTKAFGPDMGVVLWPLISNDVANDANDANDVNDATDATDATDSGNIRKAE